MLVDFYDKIDDTYIVLNILKYTINIHNQMMMNACIKNEEHNNAYDHISNKYSL